MLNKYLISGVGVLVLLFGVYFYWSQSVIEKQSKKIVTQEVTIETQKKQNERLQKDIKDIKEINKKLTEIERESAKRAAKLADKLQNLEKVAKGRPGLVENIINNAAKERNRCIELATGAQSKENEKNSVCPQLVN